MSLDDEAGQVAALLYRQWGNRAAEMARHVWIATAKLVSQTACKGCGKDVPQFSNHVREYCDVNCRSRAGQRRLRERQRAEPKVTRRNGGR
jgi:hypothetical protein